MAYLVERDGFEVRSAQTVRSIEIVVYVGVETDARARVAWLRDRIQQTNSARDGTRYGHCSRVTGVCRQ